MFNVTDRNTFRKTDQRANHLKTLDFLRGVAAFCVVLFHFSSRINIGGMFSHGYLAVDFFFCLSGYVIRHAYAAKLVSGQLNFTDFFVARVIRLMPLIILGNTAAALIDLFRPEGFSHGNHLEDILVTFAFANLLLPFFWNTTLENTAYPLNGPVWSLFFEFFANIIYAAGLIAFRGSRFCTWIVVISFVVLAIATYDHGNVHFGTFYDTFALGFPRVGFSFFLGTMLHFPQAKENTWSRWLYASIFGFLVALPNFHDKTVSALFDLSCVVVVFPLLVIAAAKRIEKADSAVSDLSGEASYPLYCLHYPFVRVFGVVVRNYGWPIYKNMIIAGSLAAVLTLGSWIVFAYYDKPIRSRLRKLLRGGVS